MVGHLPLEQGIGVRVPNPQQRKLCSEIRVFLRRRIGCPNNYLKKEIGAVAPTQIFRSFFLRSYQLRTPGRMIHPSSSTQIQSGRVRLSSNPSTSNCTRTDRRVMTLPATYFISVF